MKTPFTKDQPYAWDYIRVNTGAENPPDDERFLLHKDGRVVAACLDRARNPNAPAEALAGLGAQRETWTEVFIAQTDPVTVFVRETDGQWWCRGWFRVAGSSDEPADKNKRVKPFDIPAIYKILFLEEVPTPGAHV
jgi:hypothetical protein